MPYKRRVVNTYGRHRFRTVKPDIWAKSPAICSSENDSSDFESPALRLRKPLATCTNVPKNQWNIPNTKKKTLQTSGKENVLETSSSSSSSGSHSPQYGKTSKRTEIIQETPPWAVLGGKKSKQMLSSMKKLSIRITPTSVDSFKSGDLKRNAFSQSQSSPVFLNGNGNVSSILQGSSLSARPSPAVCDSISPKPDQLSCDNVNSLLNQSCSPEQNGNTSLRLSQLKNETSRPYSTSTPVVRANSVNSQFVTVRGRRAGISQRKTQNTSFSDCQVFIEHLKLTPEQYEAARLSLSDVDTSQEALATRNSSLLNIPKLSSSLLDVSEETNDKNIPLPNEAFNETTDSVEQNQNSFATNELSTKGLKSVEGTETNVSTTEILLESLSISEKNEPLSKELFSKNLDIENGDEEKQSSTCDNSANSNYGELLTECVVSLEKLRLSPFKVNGRLDKKRLCVRVSSESNLSNQSLSSIGEEDVGLPKTPPRNQTSHISFADVWTPSLEKEPANELDALEKLLLECEQKAPITFKEYLKPSSLKKCVKIGEGVYGEVFKTINEYKQPVALKIIPIDGDFEVNGEPQKSCQEILHEIVISKELSELAYGNEKLCKWSTPNFISVHRVSLVQDKYPAHLLKEWVKWDKRKNSENDKPDIFPKDQLFLVFEFANGGTDLESFQFKSMPEALSVLKQVTLSLAIAEASLEFEHRDLHWGNVLIISTDEEETQYTVNGETKVVDSCGVHVSVIDFTLSRLKKDGVIVFCNLAEDESLFTGQGDYQFDIYRKMQQINCNEWEKFTPATNIQWLHYLADKIINKKFPSRNRAASTALRRFYGRILQYQSAREFVECDDSGFF